MSLSKLNAGHTVVTGSANNAKSISVQRIYAAGRKVESLVWDDDYFKYDAVTNTAICQVLGDDRKPCGKQLIGRISTNAKTHLRTLHKTAYTEFMVKEEERSRQRLKMKTKVSPFAISSRSSNSESDLTPTITSYFRTPSQNPYPPQSAEALKRDQAVLDLVVQCGLPVNTIGSHAFKKLCFTLDPKYEPPSNRKMDKLFNTSYAEVTRNLRESLQLSRMVSLGMDIWTKKGYSSSYLAVTACFFDQKSHKPRHAMLNLFQIDHPHTGKMISEKVTECLKNWGIEHKKVLIVITDNGSNMRRAVDILNEELAEIAEHAEPEESDRIEEADNAGLDQGQNIVALDHENGADDDNDDDDIFVPVEFEDDYQFKRLPCVVHTLQLAVRSLEKCSAFTNLLSKARSVVRSIRISSVATQALTKRCGKTVIADCPTRWSSWYMMLSRLVELQSQIRSVCADCGLDSLLLMNEWAKLQAVVEMLEPFAQHTNTLQTDSTSLSCVIPVIFDLASHLSHLQDASLIKTFSRTLHEAVHSRFNHHLIPGPICQTFDPLPLAACLLSPDVAWILMSVENKHLLYAAKTHIQYLLHLHTARVGSTVDQQQGENTTSVTSSVSVST